MNDETSGAVMGEANGDESAKPLAVCDVEVDVEELDSDGDSVSPDCCCFLLPVTRSQNDMLLKGMIQRVNGEESN